MESQRERKKKATLKKLQMTVLLYSDNLENDLELLKSALLIFSNLLATLFSNVTFIQCILCSLNQLKKPRGKN